MLHYRQSGARKALREVPRLAKSRTELSFSVAGFFESHDISNGQLASWWGVDESFVRKILRGDAWFRPDHVTKLPPEIRNAWWQWAATNGPESMQLRAAKILGGDR